MVAFVEEASVFWVQLHPMVDPFLQGCGFDCLIECDILLRQDQTLLVKNEPCKKMRWVDN